MNKNIFGIAWLLSFSSLYGALPPLFQTTQEIKAILENPELQSHLPTGEPIVQIQKNEKGYEILTTKSRIQVNVILETAKKPGPDRFKIQFEDETL